MEDKKDIGYEIGKWYMVQIAYNDIFIPAKFVGIRGGCPSRVGMFHNFPHPGEAIFENTKIYCDCGFKGIKWDGDRYTDFQPSFRPVTENELWAVKAIEKFQKVITGKEKSFSVALQNGFLFEGKIKPPKKKDNLPGEYYAKCINPKTGEKKEGKFNYDGKSESVQSFLLSKLPGWHIVSAKQQKIFFGIPPKKEKRS